jgi:hypothetical protein
MSERHAFSGSLRRARWGVSSDYDSPTANGADQQLRMTFTKDFDQSHSFLITVKILQEMAAKYTAHPEVVQFTRRLFNRNQVLNHDELGEIQSIVNYFQGTHNERDRDSEVGRPLLVGDKGSYRYQKDPYGHELFQSPVKVLRDIQAGESGADCDDIAATAACCLNAAGYPSMLMIVDADPSNKGVYNHVMLATKTLAANQIFGNDWFPIELIHPFNVGQSVRPTKYIPLYIEDYDREGITNLIPASFR